MKLKKQKGNRNLERHLEDERLRGRRFLYHGLLSWGYILPVLLEGIAPNLSFKNEFGRGVYFTNDLSLAWDYDGIWNDSILIFDWNDDKRLLTKTLSGEKWENTVKGWICICESKHLPPIYEEEDMLIGVVTNNYNAILHCSKPEPSKYKQFVARTDQAYSVLTRSLFAIIRWLNPFASK